MTISAEKLVVSKYAGDGVTTTFGFTFRAFYNENIKVLLGEGAVETQLVYGTDYTVSINGTGVGGTITLTNPLEIGSVLAITRFTPMTQELDLENQGAFFAEDHENEFDKLTAILQELEEKIGLCLSVSETGGTTPEELLAELAKAMEAAIEAANKAAEFAVRAEAAEARAETEWGFSASEAVWTTSTAITAGTTVTVPDSSFRYLVGHKHFLLFVDGIECFRGLQFNEVGALDTKSKQFIPTFDIPAGSQIHCWSSALGSGSDDLEPRVAALEATLLSLEGKFSCHTTPVFPPLPGTGTVTQRVTDLETLCTYIEGVAVFRTTPTMPTITGTGTDLARVEVLEAWVPAFESCVTYWTP